MIELSILKAFAERRNYESYYDNRYLNPLYLNRETIEILKAYKEYYSQFPNHEQIDFNEFKVFFFVNCHPSMDDNTAMNYKNFIDQIVNSSTTENVDVLIKAFEKQEFYNQIQTDLNNNIEINQLESKLHEFLIKNPDQDEDPDMDLEEALKQTDRTNGLKWRLDCLNENHGPVIKGDFILVVAPPGKGKSSFLASELSYMGEQLRGDDYILWGVNEDDYIKYLMRVYCASLDCTRQDVLDYKEEARKKYKELMHGDHNRLKIINIHQMSAKDIEKRIKKKTPRLLAIDLMDKVNGFDKFSSKESDHGKYEKLYRWGRDTATLLCPVIATSQTNKEGTNTPYPKMTDIRQSAIDKQGDVTALLFIGAKDGDSRTRYLSMPKTKSDGASDDWKAIVQFNYEKSRYE